MLGTTLGPYRIDAELGSGGMGKVYAAIVEGRCPGLAVGTRVALKVVHPHLLETPDFFKRFLREAEMGKRVVHENVVRTFDCDSLSVDGRRIDFLVMEHVEGQTLRQLLAELDRVPEELCRHIGREVAKGLAAIHAAGVVHRDVKPENVLITREHVVKVMDLGVARLANEALRLSQTGAFVGSIHYAAPECFGFRPAAGGEETIPRSREGAARSAKGDGVDHRADLHALGLVLYELSCGVNPYLADDVAQILKRVLHEEPRRLGDVNPQLSPFFEEVVHCLLAKKPADRFADATTLLAVLEEGETSDWWNARAKAIRAVTHRPLRRIRIPRETSVHGREAELALLRSLYERASKGDGQVVVIEGEAGIGKSRVIDELIARLQRDGEELNFLFGSYPPGGAATAAGAFSTAFREQFGDAGSASYLTQSPVLVRPFDALLRGETTPRGVEPLTRDSLQTCFVHATRNLAAERTTVLLIDDLHFATEDARSLFTSLALAVPGHRILLVGTTRPGIDEKWFAGLSRLPQTSQMTLHRLGPKDLAELLKDSLGSDALALSLAGQIGLKSDGNPFFVFEILRGLREGQFITRRDDGTWVSTRVIADIKIPSSILDLVNARVADLTQEERDLLDVASCWGFEFDPAVIADAVGEPLLPTLKRFASVEKKHRLVRASGRRLVFDHHQVQEALYGALYEQMREAYHAALASTLETRAKAADKDPATLGGALCVDLCEHFLKGAQGERAMRYLTAAHAHLEKGCLNAQAASLTERALAVPDLLRGAERARALLRLATGPLDRLGRRARQEEAAREALRLAEAAGDGETLVQAAHALGWCLYQTSRHAEAEASFGRSRELAASRGDGKAEAAAEGSLGAVFRSQGRLAQARAQHESHLASSRAMGDRSGEASATANLGNVCFSEGRLGEALELYERYLAICRETGNRAGVAAGTGNLGIALFSLGRLAEAREHFERFLAASRERGDRHGEAQATEHIGSVLHQQGRRAQAREHFERSLEINREIGHRRGEATALHNLGSLFLEEGETASAKDRLVAALAVSEEMGFRHFTAAVQLALGVVHAESGDEVAAREWLTKSRDVSSRQGYAGVETVARCHLACLVGGDVVDALRSFATNDERLHVGERLESRWLLWRATGDRTHLAQAQRLLEETVSQFSPQDRASALANLRLNRDIAAAASAAGL